MISLIFILTKIDLPRKLVKIYLWKLKMEGFAQSYRNEPFMQQQSLKVEDEIQNVEMDSTTINFSNLLEGYIREKVICNSSK